MFRGIDPERHGLVDNTRLRPGGGSQSFLAATRAAGRTTASVLCWLPLDELIEPDAADHRVALDSGYDPLDDDRVTAIVTDLLADEQPDVTLTYLVACDLAGHAHGWDSTEYLAAVVRTDELLGELVAAAPDHAVVVTTDHGGLGRGHGDPAPATMTTFVVARSRRLAPLSAWTAASILDIAPTVADLAGAAPDPAWEGASLLGRERPLVDHVLGLIASQAEHTYGERVDMLSHSLQAAACARRDGATDELVLAALLHDVGHLLGDAGQWGLPDHAELGARALQAWFPAEVVDPVRLHVAAKRYLVTADPAYRAVLSAASIAHARAAGWRHGTRGGGGVRRRAARRTTPSRCDGGTTPARSRAST